MLFAEPAPPASPVGDTVPSQTLHAVSVSLPTWQDNVDYEEGAQRIKEAMRSGYPRFFIHHLIDRLAQLALAKFGDVEKELCLLLPSRRTAEACQHFMQSKQAELEPRVVEWPVSAVAEQSEGDGNPGRVVTVFAVFCPSDDFPLAKQFWQHTGDGIQSRVAERCLILLGEYDEPSASSTPRTTTPASGRYATKAKRYATSVSAALAPSLSKSSSASRYSTAAKIPSNPPIDTSNADESIPEPSSPVLTSSIDSLPSRTTNGSSVTAAANGAASELDQEEDVLSRYVEERYGRNLDLSLAPLAKLAMRRRIAGVLREAPGQAVPVEKIKREGEKGIKSDRGVEALTEDEVYLYPTGMSAIWHAHQLAMKTRKFQGGEVGKAVCFGFPYTDTLKILEKWGPGCHFLGHGLSTDLPALRALAERASPPLLAVFCEFPSNPLLRSPPLKELRALADKFGFMVVVDETIAGFVNVETLPLADVVCSSLTKVFSGDCNVMGGSLVINPSSPHFPALKAAQEEQYEDHYFDEDAIYMERNSRDFQDRISQMNSNTEAICDFLLSRRASGPAPPGTTLPPSALSSSPVPGAVIKDVYYPKYQTPEHYLAAMRPSPPSNPHASGFGALFSLTFTSLLACRTFFDALDCYKGPSLGTNFTISCPYTILAHYGELDWAKGYGVDKGLVRISVGLEKRELLMEWMEKAVGAAEKAVREALE